MRIRGPGPGLDTDGDINTGGEVELFELIDRAGGGIDDVEEAFVGSDFELFGGLLVDVDGAVHAELLDAGGQRDGSCDPGTGALGGFHDFLGGAVDRAVVEGTQADADFLVFHGEKAWLAWLRG